MFFLRLLGGASIEGEHGAITGRAGQRSRVALLALIATADGRSVSRDKLIAYLWAESGEDQGRHRLSESLYVLRKALGESAIISEGDNLRLSSDLVSSDVGAFEAALERGDLERAVSLYTGPFLDGFFPREAPAFERWLDSERQRLANEYGKALEVLGGTAERESDFRTAADYWQRLVLHDPYNSRFILNLMRALAAAGDPANALKHAQEHVAFLQEELGIEPPAELRALAEEMGKGVVHDPTPESGDGGRDVEVVEGTGVDAGEATGRHRSSGSPTIRYADRQQLQRSRKWIGLAAVAVVSLALALTSTYLVSEKGADLAIPERQSIAVLPFEELSSDPDAEYLSAAITGEIINHLSRIADLKVISRASTRGYESASVRDVGRELDVQSVLEGQIQRVDDRLRVNVQLVDVATDGQLWAEQYNREFTEILEIQSDIAREIAEALSASLSPEAERQIARRPTGNLQAFDYYLRGNAYFDRLLDEEDCVAAAEMYEKAVELDPSFADAWAALARAQLQLAWLWYHTDGIVRAKEALDQAIAIDPDLMQTRLALGDYLYYGRRDYGQALVAFSFVAEHSASNAYAIAQVGFLQRRMGLWDEAVVTLEQAIELDPRFSAVVLGLGSTNLRMRRYEEAARYYDRAIALTPDIPFYYVLRVLLDVLRGDKEGAQRVFDRALERFGADELSARSSMWFWLEQRIFHDDYVRELEHVNKVPAGDTTAYHLSRGVFYGLARRADLERAHYDSARVLLETKLSGELDFWTRAIMHSRLGLAYAGLGEFDLAIENATRATELMPASQHTFEGPHFVYVLAQVYVEAGRHNEAVGLLEYLLSIPAPLSTAELKLDPLWDPLRDHPRFQTLLETYE